MDLSCLANNRKSFFVSFHSSSCRYAENFKSFPLLSFTSFIHFWKLYIPNLCLCLDSICPQLPSEDAGRITPIFYQNPTGLLSRIRYVKSILLSSHPLDVSGSLHRQNSPRSLHAELPVFTHSCKQELPRQVQHQSKTLSPPQGLQLTEVAFCLNALSLSGVKNKACQRFTACREKDINYSRQRVEKSCLE